MTSSRTSPSQKASCREVSPIRNAYGKSLSRGNGRLFLAIYEGRIIGGLICLIFGKKMSGHAHGHALHVPKASDVLRLREGEHQMGLAGRLRVVQLSRGRHDADPGGFQTKIRAWVVSLVGYYDLPVTLRIYRLFNYCEFRLFPDTWKSLLRLRKRLSQAVRRPAGAGCEYQQT